MQIFQLLNDGIVENRKNTVLLKQFALMTEAAVKCFNNCKSNPAALLDINWREIMKTALPIIQINNSSADLQLDQ